MISLLTNITDIERIFIGFFCSCEYTQKDLTTINLFVLAALDSQQTAN